MTIYIDTLHWWDITPIFDPLLIWTLLPNLTFYLIVWGFHRTFALLYLSCFRTFEFWTSLARSVLLFCFVFFGPIGKPRLPPRLWFAITVSKSPVNPLIVIQRNLTGSKISTSSTNFVFSGWSEKEDSRPAFDLMRYFRLLWNRWTEFNETWQEERSRRLLPSLWDSSG